jgi:hypothetical protein
VSVNFRCQRSSCVWQRTPSWWQGCGRAGKTHIPRMYNTSIASAPKQKQTLWSSLQKFAPSTCNQSYEVCTNCLVALSAKVEGVVRCLSRGCPARFRRKLLLMLFISRLTNSIQVLNAYLYQFATAGPFTDQDLQGGHGALATAIMLGFCQAVHLTIQEICKAALPGMLITTMYKRCNSSRNYNCSLAGA